jgi:hypothetical protein
MRGGAMASGGEAYFFLDFFGSFLHQGKKNKSILILK